MSTQALPAAVVAASWLAVLVLTRRRPQLATLAGLNALAWSAALLLPMSLTWHRGALVHLVLAGGAWLPRSSTARAVVAAGWVAGVLAWPWVWVWTSTPLSLAVLVAAAVERRQHRVSLGRLVPWRAATALTAVALAVPPLLGAAGLPRSWALTVLIGYAVSLVLVAALLVGAARPWAPPWATDLAVELGTPPRELLERALATTRGDPREVDEQAAIALTAAAELHRRLALRQEEVDATLEETERSRRRLETVDTCERLGLRRALDDVAVARLQSVVTVLTEGTAGVAAAPTERALHHLRLAVVELDGLAEGLVPTVLGSGLSPALTHLAATTPVPVSVELPDATALREVPEDVAACVYYVAAEALANVVKHARAGAVLLRLHVAGQVELVVVDDGVGTGPTPAGLLTGGAGTGLAGLRERAEGVGGRVDVTSLPGHGTRLRLTVPLPETATP